MCPVCRESQSFDSITEFKKIYKIKEAATKIKKREKKYIEEI